MRIRVAAIAGILAAVFTLCAATAADAPATAADICKAAPANFAPNDAIEPRTLMKRIKALGIELNDRDGRVVEDTCKFTAMIGGAGLPMLHLAAKDGTSVDLVLQVDHQGGSCEAIVLSLKGC